MLLPRELIYRERRLEEFEIDNSKSIFYHLYEIISYVDGMAPHNAGAYETITKTLNTICYICTDAMLQPIPKLAIDDYVNYIVKINPLPSIKGLTYVAIVLNSVEKIFNIQTDLLEDKKYRDFYTTIVKRMAQADISRNINISFHDYFEELDGEGVWDDRFITPRAINDEFLQAVNWQKLTNDYKLDCIRFIVRYISKDDSIKLKVIQSIRKEVIDNDPNQLPF